MGKIRIFLVITLLAFANVVFSQDGKVLNVERVKQGATNLCWATTAVEILHYYYGDSYKGQPITLCNFVAMARPNDCDDLCIKGISNDSKGPCTSATYNIKSETFDVMGSKWDLSGKFVYGNVSNPGMPFSDCKNNISDGKPFIIRQAYVNSGHVIVCNGYAEDNSGIRYLYYIDSGSVNGDADQHICTYERMQKGVYSTLKNCQWDWTYVFDKKSANEKATLIFNKPMTSNKQVVAKNDIQITSVISAKSVTFEFGNEFTANPGFEVKLGSTVEIKPNTTLKCK